MMQEQSEGLGQAVLANFTLKAMSGKERSLLLVEVVRLEALQQALAQASGEASADALRQVVEASYALLAAFLCDPPEAIEALSLEEVGQALGYLLAQLPKKKVC